MPEPTPDTPPAPSRARGLLGAALGAAAGVAAWAALASATDLWTGFCALLVGALAGFGSKRLGGRGTPAAAGAALLTLAGLYIGQGFGARVKFEENLAGRIAAVDRKHYDDFAAAADDWDPRLRGDEIAKFAFKHEFIAFGQSGGTSTRVAAFHRDTVPLLEAWKRSPPPFEAWQARTREEIRRDASPWGAYLASPFDFLPPLDLLLWLLGTAAAAFLANVPEPRRVFRRRGVT